MACRAKYVGGCSNSLSVAQRKYESGTSCPTPSRCPRELLAWLTCRRARHERCDGIYSSVRACPIRLLSIVLTPPVFLLSSIILNLVLDIIADPGLLCRSNVPHELEQNRVSCLSLHVPFQGLAVHQNVQLCALATLCEGSVASFVSR